MQPNGESAGPWEWTQCQQRWGHGSGGLSGAQCQVNHEKESWMWMRVVSLVASINKSVSWENHSLHGSSMDYVSSQMMWVTSCLHDNGGRLSDWKRGFHREQACNKDTPIKFPRVLCSCCIVKIRSESTFSTAPIDIHLETLHEFCSFFQTISPGSFIVL